MCASMHQARGRFEHEQRVELLLTASPCSRHDERAPAAASGRPRTDAAGATMRPELTLFVWHATCVAQDQ